MPKFDFTTARQIKNSAGEILEFKADGGIQWAKPAPLPTGGEITTAIIDGKLYRIHTFKESGFFKTTRRMDIEYLLVGGGGGGEQGGNAVAKSGGAGGRVRQNLSGPPMRLAAGDWLVSVAPVGAYRTNGASSVFAGVVAEGGLAGNGSSGGNQGGSGGKVGGLEISGGAGAGGAGDGANGEDGVTGRCGWGGDGTLHNPDGNPRYFGGGGGGYGALGSGATTGRGGQGGGTSGESTQHPTPNSGGGAGGYRTNGSPYNHGASGVVIIRYLFDPNAIVGEDPSALALDAAPAGIGGFDVLSATPTSIRLKRTQVERSYISWAVNPKWPVGTRISFNWQTTGTPGADGMGLWVRTSDTPGGTLAMHTLRSSGDAGSGTIDYILPNDNAFSYFVFVVGGGEPQEEVIITGFYVDLPEGV